MHLLWCSNATDGAPAILYSWPVAAPFRDKDVLYENVYATRDFCSYPRVL